MNPQLKYIQGYPEHIIVPVTKLVESGKLIEWFDNRYPENHQVKNDKALHQYTMQLKNQYMRKTAPLSKVCFDNKIHLIKNALGLHSYVSKVHGRKIKTKNEIRIASVFRNAPEPLLKMIVVHELAHIKEKDHDKAFYSLCCHMEPSYHQLELDARLFMIYLDMKKSNECDKV